MSDSGPEEHDEGLDSISGRFPGLSLPQQPQHDEFEDPLSAEIQLWLQTFAKAVKGMRVYALNNQMLRRYLDEAHRLLVEVLAKMPELTLFVREDRLLYGKDSVHINNDREEGLPYTFYRNAFRRITFVEGMTRDEMVSLIGAIITDYAHYDYAGEDLLTELWRLQLPHLRYLTIDAMSIDNAKAGDTSVDREEVDRLQCAIEDIVGKIYENSAADDDIVAGVSITKEDLEALKQVRTESEEDLDLLDLSTSRAIADIPPKELAAMKQSLAAESRDTLSTQLIDILVIILFKEQSASESSATISLIQELLDSLLVSQRYDHAIYLVSRLREHQAQSGDLKVIHITRHLLKLFSAETRVVPVLQAFNDDRKAATVQVMMEFLRALGPGIVPTLIGGLDYLNSQAHRRLVCDLITEYGTPDRHLLWEKMQSAKWFVVRDILQMAQRLPLEDMVGIVDSALKHEHPKVREYAVGLLRGYARGTADRLVAKYLLDEDLEVRLAAIRVAAARRSTDAKALIEVLLEREDLADRDPRELRLLMAAYAAIGGWKVIPTLDKILNPGFFARSKMTETQVAAAFALASIGNVSAKAALQRGMRTLNTRVRDACRKALARDFAAEEASDLGQGLPEMPKAPANPSGPNEPAFQHSIDPITEDEHEAIASISSQMIDPMTLSEAVPRTEPIAVQQRQTRSLGVDENAPAFEITAEPERPKPSRGARPPPGVGRVVGRGTVRDEIPLNLPPIASELVPEIAPLSALPELEPVPVPPEPHGLQPVPRIPVVLGAPEPPLESLESPPPPRFPPPLLPAAQPTAPVPVAPSTSMPEDWASALPAAPPIPPPGWADDLTLDSPPPARFPPPLPTEKGSPKR